MTDVKRLAVALSGRYTIERELGAGGMATVYLAHDVKHDRKVAVKVLRPELAAALGAERFLNEIKVTANLQHPHILPLHDSGEADGFLFYVMPYVEGESLRDKLTREKQLSVEESIEITKAIAAALDYAHGQGVIHRDIKPENILLQAGQAVIADFGIAKAIAAVGSDRLTETGLAIGTPTYMSPEQAAGSQEVDARSDVYSLGCLVYEMLGGQPPFTGPTVESIVHQHIAVEPPPISNLRPSVPAEVGAALARSLAKAPADRFATAGQLGDALRTTVVSSTTSDGASGWNSANLAVAASIVVMIAVAGWFLRPTGGSAPDNSIAVLPFTNVSGEDRNEAFTNGIHDDLLTQIAKIGGLRVISRTSMMEYRNTTKNIRQIARELGVATVLEGGVQRAGDVVRINVQLIDAASDAHLWAETYQRDLSVENIFAIQSHIAEQIAAALEVALSPEERDRIEAVPTDNLAAYDFYLQGNEYRDRPGQSYDDLQLAQQMYERAVRLDPEFGLGYAALSQVHSEVRWFGYDETEARRVQARAAVDRALQIDPEAPEAHWALGMYYYRGFRDYDRALEELTIAERGLPGSAALLAAKTYVLRRIGRWDEVLANLVRLSVLQPRDGTTLSELGDVYAALRRYREADSVYAHILDLAPDFTDVALRRRYVAISMTGDVTPLRNLLDSLPRGTDYLKAGFTTPVLRWRAQVWSGDYAAALASLAETDETYTENQHESIPLTLLVGLTLLFAGDTTAAHTALDSARSTLERLIDRRPEDERLRQSLAHAYAGMGRRDDALREARRAVEILPISRDAYWGPRYVRELAVIHAMVGDYDGAMEQLETWLDLPGLGAVSMKHMALDPRLGRLREDPRFQALVDREQN